MQRLFDTQKRLLESTKTDIKRYLFNQINWGNRLIAITGQRGTGKTTLILQRILELNNENENLYISADGLFIYRLSLFEIALDFRNNGGKTLYIDEVHKYPNWSGEIKHIYDTIQDLNVVITGSSILDIMKGYGDLSRRGIQYTLHGISFREYLHFETGVEHKSVTIKDLTSQTAKIKLEKPLFHFKNYLKKGFYPFYTELDFELRLLNVVNTTLEVDLVQYLDLKPSSIAKLKKLLQIISESVPFKPNITKIADLSGISRTLLPDYLSYLHRAELITMIQSDTKGIQGLGKPEKIYLNNTNLVYALVGSEQANTGNIRETFFMSQVRGVTNLTIPKKGDFTIDKTVFEIGGKNKNSAQLKEIESSFLVLDGIETGYKNKIPLWQFGFLY